MAMCGEKAGVLLSCTVTELEPCGNQDVTYANPNPTPEPEGDPIRVALIKSPESRQDYCQQYIYIYLAGVTGCLLSSKVKQISITHADADAPKSCSPPRLHLCPPSHNVALDPGLDSRKDPELNPDRGIALRCKYGSFARHCDLQHSAISRRGHPLLQGSLARWMANRRVSDLMATTSRPASPGMHEIWLSWRKVRREY